MRRRTAVTLLLSLLPALSAAAEPAAKTAGYASVNGVKLEVAHAYLFHAPDSWEEKERNSVVLLTPAPLDAGKLRAAKTLSEALDLAPQRIVVEIRPDKKVNLAICHDGFGKGKCYTTSIYPDDWKPGAIDDRHVSGSGIAPFTGEEETVFQKYRLNYSVAFDASWVNDFSAR